jgi:hypothetical protein
MESNPQPEPPRSTESKTGLTALPDCTINRMLAIFRHTDNIDAEVDDG